MALVRLAVLGLLGYGAWNFLKSAKATPEGNQTHDGLAALYPTREQADLAIEHLVQQHGIDRSFIFVEPVSNSNSSGTAISGGDAASPGEKARDDAPLNSAIRLTVAASTHEHSLLRGALEEAGATRVDAI